MSKVNRKLVWGIIPLILLAGLAAWQFFISEQTSLDNLPVLDLSSTETQVAAKIKLLREEIERNPASAEAWGKFAMNLDIHDFKRESIQCYKQAATLDPGNFRWFYYTATALQDLGSPETMQWFAYCQNLNPVYLPFHILNGLMLLNNGRIEDASTAFRSALNIDANSSHAYLGLAQIAHAQNNPALSKQYLLKTIDINPGHGEAYALLTEVYQKLDKPEQAARAKRKALQFPNPTKVPDPLYADLVAEGVSSYWHLMRGQALNNKQNYTEASHEFSLALKAKPRAEAYNGLGFALHQMGNYPEASRQYNAAIALNPDYRDAFYNLAITLYKMGKVEESIGKLKEVNRLDPAFPDGYLNLGTYLTTLGRDSDAIATFRQGIANTSFDIRIASKLSWLLATLPYAALRDGPEAVRLGEKICETTNYEVPQNLDVLAAAYAETKQFSKAVKTARLARQLAVSTGLLDLAAAVQTRLKLYEKQRAFRVKRF